MNTLTGTFLGSLRVGGAQHHRNLTIFPLLSDLPNGPDYLTLDQAIQKQLVRVTEVSAGGSVPNLLVGSKSDVPVLLLDGQELVGARQNRLLNTSILLPPYCELIVPVSCTEHGRWSYTTPHFHSSDYVHTSRLRGVKSASVTESLRQGRRFESDQSEVWDTIQDMSDDANFHSPTGAASALYQHGEPVTNEFQRYFTSIEGQRGYIVFIDGFVTSLDFVSSPQAYASLHSKFVKSCATEAFLSEKPQACVPEPQSALAFLEEVAAAQTEKHESVGLGWDIRISGERVIGSSLEHEEAVIHLCAFSLGVLGRGNHRRSGTRRRFGS